MDGVGERIQHASRVLSSARENVLQDTAAEELVARRTHDICESHEQVGKQSLHLASGKNHSINQAIPHNDPLAIANGRGVSSTPSSALTYTLPHAKLLGNAPEGLAATGSEYHCVTQRRIGGAANGYTEARVGYDGFAGRWKPGSVLRYNIDSRSFRNQGLTGFTEIEMIKAISMWGNLGVEFMMVDDTQSATFQIQYRELPENQGPDDRHGKVYARSFFPRTNPGILYVYGCALDESSKPHLANILAHEIGHILGLRHEFADVGERELPSILWGKPSPKSVMNCFWNAAAWSSVQKQDIQEVKEFYALPEGFQIVDGVMNMTVCSITPRCFQF